MENEKLVKEQSLKPMRPAKLLGLQALRLIACLGIFFSHTGIGVFSGTGAFGVSIFFILSGFLLTYNYLPKENEIKNPIKFSLKKNFKTLPFTYLNAFNCAIIHEHYWRTAREFNCKYNTKSFFIANLGA